MSYAIYDRYVHAIGDGVGALDGAPGVVLGLVRTPLSPRDASRWRWDRTGSGRPAARSGGRLRDTTGPSRPACPRGRRGVESAEAQVAGSEVILFVVQRVVGDVHLAVEAAQGAVGVKKDGRVVIDAGRALLEQRRDQDDPQLLGQGGQPVRDRAGNGLGQIEETRVLDAGRNTGSEKVRAGRRCARRAPRPGGPCRWRAANSCRGRRWWTSVSVRH